MQGAGKDALQAAVERRSARFLRAVFWLWVAFALLAVVSLAIKGWWWGWL